MPRAVTPRPRPPATAVEWLIIFVKAPTPGAVKTRLLTAYTPEQAAGLYRCLVEDTLKTARAVRTMRVVAAYAADAQFPDLTWLDPSVSMFFQHGHSLSERLIHAYQWAFDQGAASVMAIGSDAPELSSTWIRQARGALRHTDVVLGPTTDGGYHLIGLTKPAPELFRDIPWSTPHVLDQTLQRVAELRLSVRCLEPIADLDTPDDVRRYVGRGTRRRSQTATYLLKHASMSCRTSSRKRSAPAS